MLSLVIVAVILIAIMLVFVFILFSNIIKRMDDNAKKYFVNKMQDYDYILDEKQSKLNEIKIQIDEIKSANKNILQSDEEEAEFAELENSKKKKKSIVEDAKAEQTEEIKYNLNVPDYRETQFFNNYKEVKRVFTVNNEKIIKSFIAEHRNELENKEYKALKKIRDKFDEEAIYNILTLEPNEQIQVLSEVLTAKEKSTIDFENMSQMKKFDVRKLIEALDERLEKIEPTVYIYTNNVESRYDLIDDDIVVKPYNNMSEGIIIKYRDKIYDYSI